MVLKFLLAKCQSTGKDAFYKHLKGFYCTFVVKKISLLIISVARWDASKSTWISQETQVRFVTTSVIQCAVESEKHLYSRFRRNWNFLGVGVGSVRPEKTLRKCTCMKLNWNFQSAGGGSWKKYMYSVPSRKEVWIFTRTTTICTHCTRRMIWRYMRFHIFTYGEEYKWIYEWWCNLFEHAEKDMKNFFRLML